MNLFPQLTQYFTQHFIKLAPILIVLLATFITYYPGLTGSFMLDDGKVIINNPSLNPAPATLTDIIRSSHSGESGPLGRPVSMFTFAVNAYFTGNNSYNLKLTNLFIHILNGLLVLAATWLILSAFHRKKGIAQDKTPYIISVFVATVWLLHPLNVSSVLYISQRMALLSAFFTLLGIVFYCLARSSHSRQKSIAYLLATFVICWPLATFSKENGALLPGYLFLIECFFFKLKIAQTRKSFFIAFFTGLTITAIIAAIYYLPTFINWMESIYHSRPFTLSERTLTEGRALWLYISFIFLPLTSRMGLFHDDFIISSSIFDPITTLYSIVGIIILLVASLTLRKKFPLASWGILIFFVGHALESTILPLEPVYEHRNYLASIGLIIPFCYYIHELSKTLLPQAKLTYIALPIILVLGVLTMERSSYWGHPFLFYSIEADNHPQSSRANYEIGRLYAQSLSKDPSQALKRKTYETAKEHFIISTNNSPYFTGGLFGLINMNSSLGITTEKVRVDKLENRLSILPVSSMATSWITNFVNCHTKPTCPIDKNITLRSLTAATNNPFITSRQKSILLSAHAGFSANTLADYKSATRYAQEAIEIAPHNPLLHLNISQLHIATGRFKLAEESLNKASSFDAHKEHSSSIKNSRSLLTSLQKQSHQIRNSVN